MANFIFSSRLHQLRSMYPTWTQVHMAKVLNMQPNAYQQYEHGGRLPKLDKFFFIAQYFCVSSDWLLGLTNDMRQEYFFNQALNNFIHNPLTTESLAERVKADMDHYPDDLPAKVVQLRAAEDMRDNGLWPD